jgi:hypothetical protein
MARAGTAGYIEDFISASAMIKTALGGQVTVAPLPPMFYSGCSAPEVVRTCAEVAAWFKHVYGDSEQFLAKSFEAATKLLQGTGQTDYARRVRLPMGIVVPPTKMMWSMEGFKLKNRVLPISSSTEAGLVLSIIDELRTNLALEIDPAPSFDRAMKAGPKENKRALQYLVLGNHKADKLTEGLKSSGVTAEAVTLEEWRANPISIGLMLDKVKMALTEVRPETLILIGLESSFYQAQTEDGFTLPIKKGSRWPLPCGR